MNSSWDRTMLRHYRLVSRPRIFVPPLLSALSFSLVLFSVGYSTVASAAPQEEAVDLLSLSLEELMEVNVDVVYTASKYQQKVTDAPSSVSIITSDQIKRYGYNNFADILRSIRGFHVTNDRNYQYLGVRGFGLPSDYSNRILLLVDGLKTNENVYDSPLIDTAFPLDIDLIERVEIVRGPSSSLYGSSAFFAVVNVITKQGRDLSGIETAVEAGSFNSYKTRASYGTSFENGVDMLVSASFSDSDGNDRLYFKEFDDASTNFGIANDLDGDESMHLLATFNLDAYTLQGNYHRRTKAIPTAPWGTIFNNKSQASTDETLWLDLKYSNITENGTNVLARINYNYATYAAKYPYEGDPEYDEAPIVINDDSMEGQWIGGELQVNKSLWEKHNVTLGTSLQYNMQQDQRSFSIGAPDWSSLNDQRDSNNWALYLQDEFQINDTLAFHAGVRHDRYQSFGGTTNPRLALIYKPVANTVIKAIYGAAFRAPSAYELYYHDDHGTQNSNPNLQPETIESTELVLEHYFTNGMRGTINGFYNQTKNLIKQTEDFLDICDFGDPCLVFQNVGQVEAKGIEFELSGNWNNGVETVFSYTRQSTRNKETSKRLTNSSEQLAKINVIVPVYADKMFLGVEGQYSSDRKTLSGDTTDSFFIANVNIMATNSKENIELSFGIFNLFDEIYSDPGAGEHVQDRIMQDGITYRGKITYRF